MSARQLLAAALISLAAASMLAVTPIATAAAAVEVAPEAVTGDPYPGDPALEPLLVAAEDRRLIEVRSISNAAGWTNLNQGRPYRLKTGNTYTLVLIARESAYSLESLLEYSPSTFVRQPDGSYLLSENIIVEQGATLRLESPDGLVLRLNSTAQAFISIVTLGGALEIGGTGGSPVEITSWDPVAAAPDTDTADGRAYIRAIGGYAAFSDVVFHDLGFWAGTTGGVSLTGTESPEVLSDYAPQNTNREPTTEVPEVYGNALLPVGGLETLSLEPDLSGYSYVSAFMRNVVSRDNAFGMFITSADGVDIKDATFENNLVDGLVLHRYVTNTIVRNTESTHNAVDGIRLTRAATGIVLDRVSAQMNGRNGITIEGGPLADGPSATGTPIGRYGNNEVTNSSIGGNGRYGVDVVGGVNIVLDGNQISDQTMGIVVSNDASAVTISDNVVTRSAEQGIALRNGVTDATVQGNSVTGGEIGIYLRDAGGLIDRNSVDGVTNHAITLIDETGASTITDNIAAGMGPSAIDVARAGGSVVQEGNIETAWRSTKPLDVILRSIFQPLTVLWITLGLLVLITALTSIGRRKPGIRDPFADKAPLSQLTAGVVAPESLGLRPSSWSARHLLGAGAGAGAGPSPFGSEPT